MKLLKRIASSTLALVLLASCILANPMVAQAIIAGKDDLITTLSASAVAPYMMSCQPDDALVLNANTTITLADISDNYEGGVVELPRLSSEYYYQLGNNTNYTLLETVYPALAFKTAALTNSVTLTVRNQDTKASLVSVNIHIDNSVTVGYDAVYTAGNIEDPAKNVLKQIKNLGTAKKYTGAVGVYDHNLHKTSVVMDTYIITALPLPDGSLPAAEQAALAVSDFDLDSSAYTFKRRDVGLTGERTSYNVKEYVGTLNSPALRSGILAIGSKIDGDNIFDNNIGLVQTKTTAYDTQDLYYIIALSSQPYIGKISTESINSDELTTVSNTSPLMSWEAKTYYNLESGAADYAAGYTNMPAGYNNYGPVTFDRWWTTATSYGISLRSGKYAFQHASNSTITNFNVYAETLVYAGVIPHLSNTTIKQTVNTVDITYHFKRANESNYSTYSERTVTNADWASYNLPTPNTTQGYEFDGWYTDANMKTKFNKSTYSINGDQSLDLYGGESFVGGNYTVIFYNNITKREISKNTLKTNVQPTLPAAPTRNDGYKFSHWEIVDQKDQSTTGSKYDPTTFAPQKDKTYIFQTAWVADGIIANVQTDVDHFYVGDVITKQHLKVYVIEGGSSQRLLGDEEYTLANVNLNKEGKHQFIVTYTKTGATATTTITVEPITLVSLNAIYAGGTVTVGDEIPVNLIEVTGKYNNNTQKKITGFSISPKKISAPGENTITVTYEGVTTKVVVNGKAADTSKTKKLSSFKVTWAGGTPTVGDYIGADDLLVVASYDDGSKENIDFGKFKYSPTQFKTSGAQTITVTYGGKKSTVKVTVKKAESSDSGSGSSSSGGSTTGGSTTGGNSGNSGGSSTGGSSGNTGGTSASNSGNSSTSSTSNNSTPPGQTYADYLNNLRQSVTEDSGGSSGTNSTATDSGHNTTVANDETATNIAGGNGGPYASPLYLAGATILTNTMTSTTDVKNSVDITGKINEAEPNSDLSIYLINGASGNDITEDMLNNIKAKKLNVFIGMLTSETDSNVVAVWKIKGESLDKIKPFNPNIVFEVEERPQDKIVYFTTASTSFPDATKLNVMPLSDCYEIGDLIRVYTTDLAKSNSQLFGTLNWKDSENTISVNLEEKNSYVLTDALEPYPDGSNFADPINDMGVEDNMEANGVDEDDFWSEDGEEEVGDDFWVDDKETDTHDQPKEKKSLSKLFPILLIVLGVIALLAVIAFIINLLRARATAPKSNFVPSNEPVEFDDDAYDENDIPEPEDDDEEIPEPQEPEPEDEFIIE